MKFIVDGLADLPIRKTATAQPHSSKPKVAFIDDDSFLRKIVPTTMADADVQTFASPEEFLKSCSLRDFHRYPGILILFSDGTFAPDELQPVDLHLMKSEIPTWKELCSHLDPELVKMKGKHFTP